LSAIEALERQLEICASENEFFRLFKMHNGHSSHDSNTVFELISQNFIQNSSNFFYFYLQKKHKTNKQIGLPPNQRLFNIISSTPDSCLFLN
jgi:hypothetical protein